MASPARPLIATACTALALAAIGCGGHHRADTNGPKATATAAARTSQTALARFGPDRIAYDLDVAHDARHG